MESRSSPAKAQVRATTKRRHAAPTNLEQFIERLEKTVRSIVDIVGALGLAALIVTGGLVLYAIRAFVS